MDIGVEAGRRSAMRVMDQVCRAVSNLERGVAPRYEWTSFDAVVCDHDAFDPGTRIGVRLRTPGRRDDRWLRKRSVRTEQS